MSRLIIVSNRVAVPKARGAAGAQGGLAGALSAALRDQGGIWFGWSGEECDRSDGTVDYQKSQDGVGIATIDLEPQDIEEYYNGYANSTLWPLFHYRIDLTQYEREYGKGYERVNDLFAHSVQPMVEPGDVIWVHDYHFMPLGERLRRRGVKNPLGFFLHIPWPPKNVFITLPFHERLVRSLLHYDLLGFQNDIWLQSFLHYCEQELGADVNRETGEINHDNCSVVARAYPIGIDYDHFVANGDRGGARQAQQRLESSTRHRTAMIGVDRLDYSKGLPERFNGIARFFERYPERVRELVFVQIAPPSREDIGSYQDIREMLERKAGHINGAISDVDMTPIRYVNKGYSQEELFGFYRGSKIGLVTPLRDGMNLVAKEYVAAQDPADPGVLILSRFAGAAEQMPDAVLVNPHSADELADAIHSALDMPLAERKTRYEKLIETVRNDNVQRWTENFVNDLRQV